MKNLILTIILLLLTGCLPQQLWENGKQTDSNSLDTTKTPSIADNNSRVSYLKEKAFALNYDLNKFYKLKNLFTLMTEIQEGEITTDDLSEAMFYFKDRTGKETGSRQSDTYFRCFQVIKMGDRETVDGREVPVYMALYSNPQIDMTVTVLWTSTKPLQGQKLNVDFLVYYDAESYETKSGLDKTQVIFSRPSWSGRNGTTVN